MKRMWRPATLGILAVVLIGGSLIRGNALGQVLTRAACNTAAFSAIAAMPEGGKALWQKEQPKSQPAHSQMPSSPDDSSAEEEKGTSPDQPSAAAVAAPSGEQGKVIAQTYRKNNANVTYGNVWISNHTSKTIDLEAELHTDPPIQIPKTNEPVVLIYHTHATESYVSRDDGTYDKNAATRTTDNTKNMVAVGEVLAQTLEENGIGVLHDKTQHDYPSYNGGYTRSLATLRKQLKEHPTIQVALDLHRDALSKSDGTKIKPVASINGQNAAQIMIASGCQDKKVTQFPNWKENFRFALQIQQQCADDAAGLTRPLYLVDKKYNEYIMPGSLLIEIGSDGNTLAEAKYSARLLGTSLARVLKRLM